MQQTASAACLLWDYSMQERLYLLPNSLAQLMATPYQVNVITKNQDMDCRFLISVIGYST